MTTTPTRAPDPERAELLAGLAAARSAPVGATRGIDDEHPRGEARSVRQVLVHLITETARHADLLRESLDDRSAC